MTDLRAATLAVVAAILLLREQPGLWDADEAIKDADDLIQAANKKVLENDKAFYRRDPG